VTRNEILRRFPNAKESFIRLNLDGDGVGAVSPSVSQSVGRERATTTHSNQERIPFRVVVSLINFRRVELDFDGLVGAFKHIQDAVSKSLHLDDGDKRLKWQYQQLQTSGEEGVLVRVELFR